MARYLHRGYQRKGRDDMVAHNSSRGQQHDSHSNGSPAGASALHQVGTILRRQRLPLRSIAQRWGVELSEIRRQQTESTDLTLSQLYRWQRLLRVPVTQLLMDHDEPLSEVLRWRAQLIRVMKTAVLIQQTAREVRTQRLITTLVEQLTQIMPELAAVGPTHGSGARRGLDDLGRAADYQLSEDTIDD